MARRLFFHDTRSVLRSFSSSSTTTALPCSSAVNLRNLTKSPFVLLFAAAMSIPLVASRPKISTLEQATAAQCGDTSNKGNVSPAVLQQPENPLWPSGVSPDMVNKYVDEILADPAINMRSVPDSMERIIYVSTVRVTLNAVYEALSNLHGTELLGHRLVLVRCGVPDDTAGLDFTHNTGKIDVTALEALADELLKSKAINQRWLPDVVERQVYANCLRIVFTILDKVADTLSFRMCGHELSLSFEPVTEQKARELGRRQQRKDLEIDSAALDAIVDETVAESQKASTVVAAISYLPLYGSFLRALHKTLYSLILGIVDDLLSKTEIMILEDSIQIKLVPEREIELESFPNTTRGELDHQQSSIRSMKEELEEAKLREKRARYMASALATISLASIAAAVSSRRHRP